MPSVPSGQFHAVTVAARRAIKKDLLKSMAATRGYGIVVRMMQCLKSWENAECDCFPTLRRSNGFYTLLLSHADILSL
jgi:hypothetical protein